tara:strand:- start:30077 stop:30211 length:135 start_codon:yes stop_codon:yes gene_type:complete
MTPRPNREREQLRAKTLALMTNPPGQRVERMRGHRQWIMPVGRR